MKSTMFRDILRVAATFAVVFFWPRQGCAATAETTVVGYFVGTTNSGNIGGPADGDDYTTEIEVDSENNVKLFLPKWQCGSNWQALEVIEEKYLKFTNINAFGPCLPDPTPVTLQHVAGTEWSYRWETDTRYGIGTLRYVCLKDCGKGNFCSSSALDEEQGLTFAEDGSIGTCFPLTAETQNAFYDEQNASLQCPFESLAQAVDGGNQDVVLDVYLDSSEGGNTNGVYNFDSKRDDKPTTSILRGQELVAPVEGCQTNSLAAQRQDDAVCFTYEIYETSLTNFGSSNSRECGQTCIAIGSSGKFKVWSEFKMLSNSAGSFTSSKSRECRVAVSNVDANEATPDSATTTSDPVTEAPTQAPSKEDAVSNVDANEATPDSPTTTSDPVTEAPTQAPNKEDSKDSGSEDGGSEGAEDQVASSSSGSCASWVKGASVVLTIVVGLHVI